MQRPSANLRTLVIYYTTVLSHHSLLDTLGMSTSLLEPSHCFSCINHFLLITDLFYSVVIDYVKFQFCHSFIIQLFSVILFFNVSVIFPMVIIIVSFFAVYLLMILQSTTLKLRAVSSCMSIAAQFRQNQHP